MSVDRARHLIDAERLRVYPRLVGGALLVIIVWWYVSSHSLLDSTGIPVGGDFISFYAAGKLALMGTPELAYSIRAHEAMERTIIALPVDTYFSWHYPPIFLLVAAGLAAFPFLLALVIWQGLTLIAFLAVIRRIAPLPGATTIGLAFGGTFLNLINGQTGFLSAALVGLFVLHFLRRPWLAGAALGASTFKPHFVLAMGVLTLVSLRWRVAIGAILSSGTLVLVSLAVFGVETWRHFLQGMRGTGELMLVQGGPGWHKMVSLFAALRGWGVGPVPAMAMQVILAALTAVVILMLWQRRDRDARTLSPSLAAAVALGTLLMPPYALDYDLVIVGVALASLATLGRQLPNSAVLLLAAAWIMPLASRPFGALGAPVSFVFLLALLVLTYRMHRRRNAFEDALLPR